MEARCASCLSMRRSNYAFGECSERTPLCYLADRCIKPFPSCGTDHDAACRSRHCPGRCPAGGPAASGSTGVRACGLRTERQGQRSGWHHGRRRRGRTVRQGSPVTRERAEQRARGYLPLAGRSIARGAGYSTASRARCTFARATTIGPNRRSARSAAPSTPPRTIDAASVRVNLGAAPAMRLHRIDSHA